MIKIISYDHRRKLNKEPNLIVKEGFREVQSESEQGEQFSPECNGFVAAVVSE